LIGHRARAINARPLGACTHLSGTTLSVSHFPFLGWVRPNRSLQAQRARYGYVCPHGWFWAHQKASPLFLRESDRGRMPADCNRSAQRAIVCGPNRGRPVGCWRRWTRSSEGQPDRCCGWPSSSLCSVPSSVFRPLRPLPFIRTNMEGLTAIAVWPATRVISRRPRPWPSFGFRG
jgi:hypothetical protein